MIRGRTVALIKLCCIALFAMLAMPVMPVMAEKCDGTADDEIICCAGVDYYGDTCPDEIVSPPDAEGELIKTVRNVSQTLIMLVGSIAGIVIVIAGIMYASAIGNPEKTATARKMILYAVVGLIISLSAYAITSFILGSLEG